jgi:sugar fermentation stimulation protein A
VTYENVCQGAFISRPNRFIAKVEVDGKIETAHVKNTGRCKELLVPGARVVLSVAGNPKRKTGLDLVSVWKGNRLINMDSQAPNKVFLEWLKTGSHVEGITHLKPEARYGSSRFDFYLEAGSRKMFIEVKGVTLEEDGVVLFPDAPTIRGARHLNELAQCVSQGYEAQAVFVVQMKGVDFFTPNRRTHPEFGQALDDAVKAGVQALAFDCEVDENSLKIGEPVQIKL